MKKLIIRFASIFTPALFMAQGVGHTTITFNDPARSTTGYGSGGGPGRQIQTEVYYPAASTADNVPVVGTNLPVVVFGHGFSMVWSAYDNVWTNLVAEGYVVAFPRTEGSLSPSHSEFGEDLRQVADKMLALNLNAPSMFFGKLSNKSAIMGHSMGGGSSFLAGANNTNITTMVTFAAANTNPSSAQAAVNVSVPNLVIAGVNDCVAPPNVHQDSMYNKLGSSCKAEVNIIGGGHCYFANTNFNCSFGEGTCSPNPTITRAQQQDVANDYTNLWLRYWLKNDCNAWNAFNDSLTMSNRITSSKSCNITCGIGLPKLQAINFNMFPNPASNEITIVNDLNIESLDVEIFNTVGQKVFELKDLKSINGAAKLNVCGLSNGVYMVKVIHQNESVIKKITISK